MTADTSIHAVPVLRRLARRTALLLTSIGALILGVAAAIALSWRGDLPDRIAVQWDAAGAASGFGSFGGNLALQLGVAAVLLAGCVLMCWKWGAAAMTRRLAVGVGVGASVTLGAQLLAGLAVQRGLAEHQVITLAPWLVGALTAGGAVIGIGVALLLPADPPQHADTPVDPDAARIPLAATERAVWLGTARAGAAVTIVLTALMAGAIVYAVATRTWGALAPLPVPLLVLGTMLRFNVRVDATGLTVRSAVGLPRTHIPAAEVLRAETTQLNPMAWGGWGWRLRGDGAAVITRRGQGLLVHRTGGRTLAVTCDDAAAAAALLNTMAERAR